MAIVAFILGICAGVALTIGALYWALFAGVKAVPGERP